MICGSDPFSLKFFCQTDPIGAKSPIFSQGRIYFKQGPAVQKKNVEARHLGRQTLFFLKKLATDLFLVISVAFIHFTRLLGCRPLFPACKKIAAPLVGAPFVGPLFGLTC